MPTDACDMPEALVGVEGCTDVKVYSSRLIVAEWGDNDDVPAGLCHFAEEALDHGWVITGKYQDASLFLRPFGE